MKHNKNTIDKPNKQGKPDKPSKQNEVYNEIVANEIVKLTTKALAHFTQLLKTEEIGTNIRIDIDNPQTQHADLQLTFCPPNAQASTDSCQIFANFSLYLSENAQVALQDAVIDFIDDPTGCQLSIKAPYLKGKPPSAANTLHDRVEYVLRTEINPALAAHSGMVSLVDILADGIVLLKFGGGCHGCGMADITLKHGIETTLKRQFPEITEIRDITEHASGANPYY